MSIATKFAKVFVYGTLKSGQPNHYWLTDVKNGGAQFIDTGTTRTKFPLIVASQYNVPFMLSEPGTGHYINGEIYSVDERMLLHLDELEDYPQLYDRTKIDVADRKGIVHNCWIYMLKDYPKRFLVEHKLLSEYNNSVEKPYLETYLDSCSLNDVLDS